MTLDEAIKHCLEKALNNDCEKCADEHLQLAMWLIELRNRRKSEYNEIRRRINLNVEELRDMSREIKKVKNRSRNKIVFKIYKKAKLYILREVD